MRRVLPVAMPPVLGYLHHAFPLSVLLTARRSRSWFLSNYVQLTCPAIFDFEASVKRRCQKLDFFTHPAREDSFCPLLETSWLDRRVVGRGEDVIEFLIRSIDVGYCVELCADQYFIPGSGTYQERSYVHEILVNGYDLESRTFVVDMGFDRAGDYTVDEIEFDQIQRSISEVDLSRHYNKLGVCLLRLRRDTEYRFDVEWFADQLFDYVNSADTSERFRCLGNITPQMYGLATYDFLTEYFAYLEEHPDCYDIRPLHIAWEHKKCMLERLIHLESAGAIPPGRWSTWYADIEQRVSVFRMMMMKARVTGDPGLIRRIRHSLPAVQEMERLCLERVLGALRSRCEPNGVREVERPGQPELVARNGSTYACSFESAV